MSKRSTNGKTGLDWREIPAAVEPSIIVGGIHIEHERSYGLFHDSPLRGPAARTGRSTITIECYSGGDQLAGELMSRFFEELEG